MSSELSEFSSVRFQGVSVVLPEKKTPGTKWVIWLSNSAKNCDKPCGKKKWS